MFEFKFGDHDVVKKLKSPKATLSIKVLMCVYNFKTLVEVYGLEKYSNFPS